MWVKCVYLISVAAILGCSGASGTSGSPKPVRTGNLLTGAQIAEANADVNTLYDALARLRPNWLAPHGSMSSNLSTSEYATVFVDGQRYGGLESLRNIQAYHVLDVRYHDVTQAGARFGIRGGTAGVIEVRIRTR